MQSVVKRETITDFDHVPSIGELFSTTKGIPGVEYAIVSNANAHSVIEEDGWSQLNGAPIFKIKGHPCIVLGRGKAIPGLSSNDAKCPLFVDDSIPLVNELLEQRDSEITTSGDGFDDGDE